MYMSLYILSELIAALGNTAAANQLISVKVKVLEMSPIDEYGSYMVVADATGSALLRV